jgi:hypothetical protein
LTRSAACSIVRAIVGGAAAIEILSRDDVPPVSGARPAAGAPQLRAIAYCVERQP